MGWVTINWTALLLYSRIKLASNLIWSTVPFGIHTEVLAPVVKRMNQNHKHQIVQLRMYSLLALARIVT